MMVATGAAISPAKAARAPIAPRNRWPTAMDRLTTLGPGRNWHRARVEAKSSGSIQPRWSTRMRRAQGKAPPNADIDIWANPR
jgi:hypothetical protein